MMYGGRAIALSPDGKQVALGCENGFVLIVDMVAFGQVIKTLKDRSSQISVVKYSANNEYLAVGGAD